MNSDWKKGGSGRGKLLDNYLRVVGATFMKLPPLIGHHGKPISVSPQRLGNQHMISNPFSSSA